MGRRHFGPCRYEAGTRTWALGCVERADAGAEIRRVPDVDEGSTFRWIVVVVVFFVVV